MATEKRLIDANRFLRVTRFQEGVYPHKILKTEIEEQPTVEAVEVVHGRWIPQEYSDPEGKYYLFHCSECCTPNARVRKYCPNCGAKMDGDGSA